MTWDPKASQGNEAAKIRWDIVPYTRGTVLDLGAGPFKAFRHFISVDNQTEYKGFKLRPDVLRDCTDLSIFASKSVDAVFSSHLLEHLPNTFEVLAEWWRVIKVGGHLVLYLPHKKFYPNKGEPGSNPNHLHDFLPEDIIECMKAVGGWDLLRNEDRDQGDEYSFYQVYRRRSDKEHSYPCRSKKTRKTCAVVRYGGIGDCIQASSVLPELKKQGYWVVFHTIPDGYKYLVNDPHIDEWFIQDKGQVENHELREFWAYQSTKYDKWVNLTEIVEATLLPVEQYASFGWTQKARHRLCDINYMELMHDVAGVPWNFHSRFYPSAEEEKWAKKEREKIGKCVLWASSGSSIHKVWPYMDMLICRILTSWPGWNIVLVGDEGCQYIIDPPWREEPRVHLKSGIWSVRETLAFAMQADMVIGPETGILNSVSLLDMPKLVWLSHSSVENLTKHWKNTAALMPTECDCYPCHQLHYGFKYCHRDEETGTARCQALIDADVAWEALCSITSHAVEEPRIWRETPMLITR